MDEIVSSLPVVEVSTNTIVEIDSTLPDAQIDVTKSITVEIQPDTYVLTSGGIYTGSMTGKVPTWILDAIQQQLTTGDGNITSVLNDMQLLLDGLQLGVNQAISQIENTNVSMSALETSLASRINDNQAAILDVYATRVTATEAQAIAAQAIGSTFGGNVDAYIGNLASVYTAPGSATATNIRTLQASYNDQTARIDTVEEVAMSAAKIIRSTTAPTLYTHPALNNGDYWIDIDNNNVEYVWNGTSWDETTTGSAEQAIVWSANASKLITAPDGSVTGWSFGDGSNTQSNFKIKAQNFSISDGITGYTPFSITGSDIQFNGKVSFSNVAGAPGGGSNLLYNSAPMLANETKGWSVGGYNTGITPILGAGLDPWRPSGSGSVYAVVPGAPAIGTVFDVAQTAKVSVIGGMWYEASAYISSHRCTSYVTIAWYDSNNTYINEVGGSQVAVAAGGALVNWSRSTLLAQAPANAARALFYIRSIVNSTDPYCFVAFAYLGQAVQGQVVFSDWSEGTSAGVSSGEVVNDINNGNTTTINGGRIATGTVTASQIAAGTITADKLSAGSITADKINAGILYNIGGSAYNYTMMINFNTGEIHIK